MGIEQKGSHEEKTDNRSSFIRNWIKRIHPIMGDQEITEMVNSFENNHKVRNPYADLNRFRLEAFRRIPGVVVIGKHILRSREEDK